MQKISVKSERAKKIRRNLRAANRRFEKLSRKEQRLAVARDVITQVKAKKYVAASTYFALGKHDRGATFDYDVGGLAASVEAEQDLGECISQVGCTVCGIGSLFASSVVKHDNLKINKFLGTADDTNDLSIDREGTVQYLSRWFTAIQLDLIEQYFEQHAYDTDSPIADENNDDKRLIMIMENILSNNGIFNPKKGAHANGSSEDSDEDLR